VKFDKKIILYIYKSIKNTELRLKMAFLMLLHEKMKLSRKINRLTLKQLHFSNLVDRMEKKTKKREQYYAKLERQIERQGNMYKNNAALQINSIFGCGANSWNPNGLFTGGGVGYSQSQWQCINQAAGKLGADPELVALYMSQPTSFTSEKAGTETVDGKEVQKYKFSIQGKEGTELTSEQYDTIRQAAQMAQYQQNQYGQMASQWKTGYENNINEWIEAQKEQLDMQKEWEMDLLAEEQADMEAEKDSIDAQIQLAQERKKNIEQMLGQSIQDAAPKFGLG